METMMRPAGIEAVRAEIARACRDAGREADSVTLVAVSKTYGPDAVEPVIGAGQRIFGENRVQEAKEKWPPLRARHGGLELHLVGPLQSNKARDAVALFDAIHSVDRDSLAAALAKEIARQGRRPLLFAEVNIGAEPQKAGVAPQEMRRVPRRLPRPARPGDFRPDVHPARGRGAGPVFRADRQDRSAQWAEAALDGDERGLPDGDRLRCNPCPRRHGDFRRSGSDRAIGESQFSFLW